MLGNIVCDTQAFLVGDKDSPSSRVGIVGMRRMDTFGHVPRACVFQCPRLGVSVDMVRAHKSSISVAVSGGDPLAQRILGERLLNLLGALECIYAREVEL